MNENVKVNIDLGTKLAEGAKQAAQLRAHLEAAAKIRLAENSAISTANKLGGGETKTSRSIGMGAGTGSAASDFAAQAQGLGGLVHVYATFAANIYAVSAAFSALSKAADVSNMVKGMDQLGAASGRALGTLSKRLVEVTDGAISMRDSMNAVAISVAGGMSNSSILRMGQVAKQASIALGRDMPDAMERLSKGIIKVQPELLDELGIMTRVIPAQQAYALSLGKTASTLTDLEKKQAFANAVLKEGEEKFGAIELSANNYSKILSSMSNIAQTSLEAVNKFLSPLVSLLASSPTALATAMGLVAAVLLKQAIPAIGYFKEASAKAAEQAEQLANRRNFKVKESLGIELAANLESTKIKQAAAKAAMQKEITAKRQHLESLTQLEIDKVDAAEKEIRNIRDASFKKSTASYKILSINDPAQVTAKDLKVLEAQAARFTKSGETDKADAYTRAIKGLKDWGTAEETFVRKDDEYKKELADHSKKLDNAYKEQEDSNAKALQSRHNNLSIIGRLQTEADRANLASATRNIASNAAQTASVKGFVASMKEANLAIRDAMSGPKTVQKLVDTDKVDDQGKVIQRLESITTPAMGRMRAGWTYLSSGISGATTAISGFMSFLGPWAAFAGLVISIGTGLYGWLSKTAKESAATTAALEDLAAATSAVDTVITSLSKKNPLEQISTESLSAKAGAFNNLAESIKASFTAVTEEVKKMGTVDVIWDFIKGYANRDSYSVAAKEGAKGLAAAIKLMGNSPEAKKAKAELSGILGNVDITDSNKIYEYLSQSVEVYAKAITEASQVQKVFAQSLSNTAAKSTELDSAFKTASRTYDTITTGLMPTDNLAKLGFEMQALGEKMSKAFQDPVAAATQLVSISDDVSKLRFFNPKIAETLLKDSAKIKEVSGAIKVYGDLINELSTKEQSLDAQIAAKRKVKDESATSLVKERAVVTAQKRDVQLTLTAMTSTIEPYLKMLKEAQNQSFTNGAKLISDSIGLEFQKAGITISKALSEGLGATVGGIEQKARLDSESIGLQIKQIQTQLSLVEVNEKLVALEEQRALREQKTSIESKTVKTPQDISLLDELEERIKGAELRVKSPIRNNQQLKQGLQSTGAEQFAAQGSINAVQQAEAASAQIAGLQAQKRAIQITKEFAILTQETVLRKSNLEVEASRLSTERARIDSAEKASAYLTNDIVNARLRNNEDIVANKLAQEYLDFSLNISKIQKVISESKDSKAIAEGQKSLTEATTLFNNKRVKDQEDRKSRELANIETIKTAAQSQFSYEQERGKILLQAKISANNIEFGLREERIAQQTALESLDAKELVSASSKLAIDRESAKLSESIANSKAEEATKLFEIEQRAKNAVVGTGDLARLKAEAEEARLRYETSREGEENLSAAKITTLGIQKEINILNAKHADEMKNMSSIADSLSVAFGEVGSAIGKMTTALLKAGQAQAKLDDRKKNLKDAKEEEKFKKDQLNTDLEGIADLTSAAKNYFDTKSDGYKILAGIEKAVAVASMAVRAQEVAATLASSAAIIAARIPAIYASFMTTMGPLGPPAAALAIAAFIGSAASGIGGSASYTPGPSAEEIQKTQGTGQAYGGDGKLYDTGGGVLGDSSAKSSSLERSIDRLSSTSVENLSYSSKMLDALLDIRNNIGKAAAALFKTTSLNKKGGGMGVGEGETYTPNIISTISKSVADNVVFKVSDALSLGLGSKIANELNKSLGGGITEGASITNQGVQLSGSFKDIANNAQGNVKQFTDVLHTWEEKLPWPFNSRKQSHVEYLTKDLDRSVTLAVGDIFSKASTMFKQYGGKLGKSSNQIDAVLGGMSVSQRISLQGLSGQALTDAFTDSINGILDDAAKKVYPELLKFQQGGEAAFETVSRVLDNSYKVSLAFDSIGKSTAQLSYGLQGYDISEALIESAGGLDNFLSLTKQFGDDFLTEAERLAPVQKALTTRMTELGFASVDTREEFKQLILNYRVFGSATTETYTSLLELAPAFNKVHGAVENTRKVLNELDLDNAKRDLQIKVLSLLGKAEESLALTRSRELSEMDLRLVNTQKYIYALEDEATARNKLNTIIKTTISTLTSAMKSLGDYRNNLVTGDKSNATPMERYASTKASLRSIAILAATQGNTDAEKAAQTEALSKLPAASDTFLAASKELYASGAQYTSDFGSVLDILDNTSIALASQKSTAELQLTQIENSTALLGIIQENTKTTAELLQEYLVIVNTAVSSQSLANTVSSTPTSTSTASIVSTIPTSTLPQLRPAAPDKWATGGFATGLSIVGEQGPELVDFKTPARVYSNRASNNMFNNYELVEEIKALRNEVSQLRKEQREQTGHIISTNYDANGQVAEAVNKTADANVNNNLWLNRVTPKIA